MLLNSCDQKPSQGTLQDRNLSLEAMPNTRPVNVVFILSDDHRYDFMGFTGKVPFLKTPNMDKMATAGTHIQNAFCDHFIVFS